MDLVQKNLRLAKAELALVAKNRRIEELEARVRLLEAGSSRNMQNEASRVDADLAACEADVVEC